MEYKTRKEHYHWPSSKEVSLNQAIIRIAQFKYHHVLCIPIQEDAGIVYSIKMDEEEVIETVAFARPEKHVDPHSMQYIHTDCN